MLVFINTGRSKLLELTKKVLVLVLKKEVIQVFIITMRCRIELAQTCMFF